MNYELAILRRMFRLAYAKKLLGTTGPTITIPKAHNERQGFFTSGELAAVLLELHDPLLERYIRLKAITGWRDKELKSLTWANVDRDRQEIRVMPASTKAKVPLLLDYSAIPDVVTLIEECWDVHEGPCVFQRHGKALKDYRGGLHPRRNHGPDSARPATVGGAGLAGVHVGERDYGALWVAESERV